MVNQWGAENETRTDYLPIITDTIDEIKDIFAKRRQEAKERIKPVSFQFICQTVVEKLGIIPEKGFTDFDTLEQYYLLCFVGHTFNALANKTGVLEDNKYKLDGGLKNKLDRSVRPTSLTFPEIYTPNFPEENIEMSKRKDITWEARNLAYTFIGELKDEKKLQEFINITETLVKGGKQTHLKCLGELVETVRQSIYDPERKIDPISKSIKLLRHPQAA
ncbi:MAG: hypothetical protein Q7K55_05150 [Candidatus Levybacteria bacterium]|nr:hypothetical protein [Candidatus Levybacteria bacterium]